MALTQQQQSAVDRAIAAAKARAEAKARQLAGGTEGQTEKAAKAPGMSKEEREALRAQREQERNERKQRREAERAEREATRAPSHMAKVVKAGEKLPQMDETTRSAYDLVSSAGLTLGQTAVLCAHLQHTARVQATLSSHGVALTAGQTVRVIGSDRDPRIIGLVGRIEQVNKIRVLVNLPGRKNPAYLFTADVEPCDVEIAEVVAEEAPIEEPTFLAPETDDQEETFLAQEDQEESTGTDGE